MKLGQLVTSLQILFIPNCLMTKAPSVPNMRGWLTRGQNEPLVLDPELWHE